MVDMTELSRANYVTNLSLSEASGGWSGFNAAMFASLSRHFALRYVGPIDPPPDLRAKVGSKIRRSLGVPGSFQLFSDRRLAAIAEDVGRTIDPSANLSFFHGSTPWIAYSSPLPFACYLDVCFATYVSVYHQRAEFDRADVARIESMEAAWLRRASRVFFSSAWGLEQAARAYALDESTLSVAGMGGHVLIPGADAYTGGRDFVFIALDFESKGGRVCVEAFERVRREIPEASLRIIGARPPENVLGIPGMVYEGRLDKSIPAELHRLQSILGSAFALIHPTVRDATPQVIVEAQYSGCPVIAPRGFGIPEMVEDGVTGYLVDPPPRAADVAERMLMLCRDHAVYARMRKECRARSLEHFTWEHVGDRIAGELAPVAA